VKDESSKLMKLVSAISDVIATLHLSQSPFRECENLLDK
jgi:hypothetical protein